MTKEEAQKIVDNINEDTIIDNDWLSYLVSEDKEYTKLKSLAIVSGMNWSDFIEKYEGCYITDFQTKKEIYVGRIIYFLDNYFLITAQNKSNCFFISLDGKSCSLTINQINNYLL